MSTDVEKLDSIHEQLRNSRALLPQLIRKLAFASEDQGSTQLFQAIAQDLMAWKSSSENLQSKYLELKPLIDEYNGVAPPPPGPDQKQYEGDGGTIDLTAGGSEFLDMTK